MCCQHTPASCTCLKTSCTWSMGVGGPPCIMCLSSLPVYVHVYVCKRHDWWHVRRQHKLQCRGGRDKIPTNMSLCLRVVVVFMQRVPDVDVTLAPQRQTHVWAACARSLHPCLQDSRGAPSPLSPNIPHPPSPDHCLSPLNCCLTKPPEDVTFDDRKLTKQIL